jgi:hypothetical protein
MIEPNAVPASYVPTRLPAATFPVQAVAGECNTAPGVCYGPGMRQRRAYLKKQLEEAARELDAATKPSQIRAAATKRRVALQGLQWLDEQEAKPKRRTSRGRGRRAPPHELRRGCTTNL